MSKQDHVADPAIDYFGDAPIAAPAPASLAELAKVAKESVDLETEINKDVVALEEKNAKLAKMRRVVIPEMMATLGMEEFKLTDGSTVSVKSDIKCGISEANKPAAYSWLEANNFDGIVKTNVKAEFGKGEMEDAKKALEALEAAGVHGSLDRSIHPATLKSFVKEQLEAGMNIPMETFGVFEFKEAKIKLPKVRK